MGFRGDEPDYSISGLPWTPKFFERFREIKGYDVQPYVALFAQTPSRRDPGIPIHLTPEQLRIKADYYDVFSQMFAAGFFKPQADWCAANHLEYQVHLNHEEMEMELVHSEGSFFRDMRYVQVPGIDAIWHQIWKDTVSDYPRLASSVVARLRQAARLYRELCRLPSRARRRYGSLHPERAVCARRQPRRDDVLPGDLIGSAAAAFVHGRARLSGIAHLCAPHELPHGDGTARRDGRSLSTVKLHVAGKRCYRIQHLSRRNGC